MISDLAIIAVILIFVVAGIRRGLASALLNITSVFAASAVSAIASAKLAPALYERFMRESVIQKIENAINAGGADFAASNSFKALPEWLRSSITAVLGAAGTKYDDVQNSLYSLTSFKYEVVSAIEKPVAELATKSIRTILFLLIFIILLFIFKMIIKAVKPVFRLPLIRQADMTLGGILGFAEGVLIACVLINITYIFIVYSNANIAGNSMYFGDLFKILCMYR